PSRSSHRGDLIEEKAREVEEKRKSVGGAPAVSPPDQTPSSNNQGSRDPRAASTEHGEGNDLGEQCVEVLEAALEEDGLTPMSSKERVRFRDEYASLVTQLGLGPDQLRGGPLRRQLERWGDIHLYPRVAYDDAAKRRYPEMDKTEWRMWRVYGWKPEDGDCPYDPTQRII
ncbi:MAG: hypothetical protein M3N45_01085, partial [Actinomycetota bacterium]|nr:hypothetical protein [Actinomycetota bacterium]